MKTTMTFLILAGCAGLAITALGQGGPGGGGGTNDYNWNYAQSNYYAWKTNLAGLKDSSAPKAYSNHFQYAVLEPGPGNQWRTRFGQSDLPADVQAMIQQFQQERQRLMSQLKTASDEQRREILREMEQLRAQLREQVSKLREEAKQQAEEMRHRFQNNRDRILDRGTAGEGSGRDR